MTTQLTPEAEAFWSSLPQPQWALDMAAEQAATGNTEGLVQLCTCGSRIPATSCMCVIEPTVVYLDRLDVMHNITRQVTKSAAAHIEAYADGFGDAADFWNETAIKGRITSPERKILWEIEDAAEAHADKSDALIWFSDALRLAVQAS